MIYKFCILAVDVLDMISQRELEGNIEILRGAHYAVMSPVMVIFIHLYCTDQGLICERCCEDVLSIAEYAFTPSLSHWTV
jgi:hypothetical protein